MWSSGTVKEKVGLSGGGVVPGEIQHLKRFCSPF